MKLIVQVTILLVFCSRSNAQPAQEQIDSLISQVIQQIELSRAPRPGTIPIAQPSVVNPSEIEPRDGRFRNLFADNLVAAAISGGIINTNLAIAGNGSIGGDLQVGGTITVPTVHATQGTFEGLTTCGLDVLCTATIQGLLYQLANTVSPNNVLYVQKGPITAPNQFNSVKAAVDSIVGNSATNRFVVKIAPGTYVENTITMKEFVALKGDVPLTCTIQVNDGTKDIIVAVPNINISSLTLQHPSDAPGSGAACVSFTGGAGPIVMDNVRFGKSDILVRQTATVVPAASIITNSLVINTSNFSTGFQLAGPAQCTVGVSNLTWQPSSNPNLVQFALLDGSQTTFGALGMSIGSGTTTIGGIGFAVQNGASLRLGNAFIGGFTTGIYTPAIVGAAPVLNIFGAYALMNGMDIQVDYPTTGGAISGVFSRSKISINPAAIDLSLLILDEIETGITTVGPLFAGDKIATITNISPAINKGTNTGVIDSTDFVGTSTSLTLHIPAGNGYLMVGLAPDDDVKYVEWAAQDLTLTETRQDQFIFIDQNGTAQASLADPDIFQKILIGKARTTDTGVLYMQQVAQEAAHTANKLNETLEEAFGPIYKTGSIVTKNGTLQLDVSNGNYFFGTHQYKPTGGTAINWNAFYRDGTGNFIVNTTNVIDYQFYDDGSGTLAAIPTDNFAKHELFVIGDGADETYALVYSQTYFTSLNNAITGDLPLSPGSWTDNIAPIASIIVQNTAVAADRIAEIRDERPQLGFVASSIAGTSDHGNLIGLLDDDHPQYLLTNGGRAMTGNLTMNNNNIITGPLGLIDGVDVSAHAARHLPLGADPLAFAVPVTINTTNSIGTSNSFALSDHVHAHGNQPGGSLHAVATQSTAGFMSAADKTLLDTIGSGTAIFVMKTGDTMTGSLTMPAGTAAAPSIQFTGSTNTGFSAQTVNQLVASTNGVARLTVGSTGTIAINGFGTAGIVHNDASGNLSTSLIVNADVDPAAAIVDTKLATISTAGKVSNSATTATSANTANALVARDGSGNFAAGTITANLTGNVTGAASLNVLKAGDTMTGTLTVPTGTAALPEINFTGFTTTGFSAPSGALTFSTGGTDRLHISTGGVVTIAGLSSTGVVHNDALGNLSTSLIVNADVDSAAAIVDTKLATISTAGKVSNSATTATSANTANAIVARDGSGNFAAGTITANLTGNVTGAASLNVLKAGDTMTGTLIMPAGTAAAPSIQFTGSTNTGFSAQTADQLVASTNGVARLTVGSTGTIAINGFGTAGIVHNDASGNLSTSLIVNADVDPAAAIVDTKLATISTAGKVSNSATTATSANTANAIVARDGSGNFAAGTITANLTGNVTGSASLNVLKAGDTMTGSLTMPAGTAAAPSIQFTGSTNTGFSVQTADTLVISTAGNNRVQVGSTGAVTIATPTSGVALTVSGAAVAATNAVTINQNNSSTTGSALGLVGAATPTGAPLTISAGAAQNSITTSLGTASLPAYSITGDTNTGMYSPAADQLAWTGGGTQRLLMDSTGTIRPYSSYKAHAYRTTSTQNINNTTATIVFNSVASPGYDINGNFNTATGVYTAPVTGYYLLMVNVVAQTTNQNGTTRTVNVRVNGTNQIGFSGSGNDTGINNQNFFIQTSGIISLTAGDTLDIQYTTARNDNIQTGSTHIDIHYISF